MIQIVIPMAGKGQRFVDAGYTTPKPFLPIGNRRMIDRVIENVRPDADHQFIFIHQLKHDMLADSFPKESILLPLTEVTEGAACTILTARDYINWEAPLLIANSDQLVDVDINDFLKVAQDYDGLIMTFPSRQTKWSYAKVEDGLVTEVAEKNPISEHATCGVYYFKHGKDFVAAAEDMIEQDKGVNGEFYVCPVFNELISKGKKVGIYEVGEDQMHGLGTPEDYEAYCEDIAH